MTSDPNLLRTEIEHTRASLSDNVDELAYQANPVHMAQRQVSKAKAFGGRLLDRILGAAEDLKDSAVEAVHGTAEGISDKASDVGHGLSDLPHTAKQQAQGNPLAAGAVAFGIGMLIASAFPASRKEQELAGDLKEKARPLTEQVGAAAKEVVDTLAEPAKEAVESVKETATDAVQTVQAEASEAADEVKTVASDSASQVSQEARDTAHEVRGQ